MATATYAFRHILKAEGGWSNDPDDLGGKTNMGVTWETYQARAEAVLGCTPNEEHFRNLSQEEVMQFFMADYWAPIQGKQIDNEAVAMTLADHAFNAGPGNAVKLAQRTLNRHFNAELAEDGVMGPNTMRAINEGGPFDHRMLFIALQYERCEYYNGIVAARSANKKFLHGWLNRVQKLTAEANDAFFESN